MSARIRVARMAAMSVLMMAVSPAKAQMPVLDDPPGYVLLEPGSYTVLGVLQPGQQGRVVFNDGKWSPGKADACFGAAGGGQSRDRAGQRRFAFPGWSRWCAVVEQTWLPEKGAGHRHHFEPFTGEDIRVGARPFATRVLVFMNDEAGRSGRGGGRSCFPPEAPRPLRAILQVE